MSEQCMELTSLRVGSLYAFPLLVERGNAVAQRPHVLCRMVWLYVLFGRCTPSPMFGRWPRACRVHLRCSCLDEKSSRSYLQVSIVAIHAYDVVP